MDVCQGAGIRINALFKSYAAVVEVLGELI